MNAKEFSFLDELDLSSDTVQRLSLHLDRTKVGSDSVIVSPIAENISPPAILERWARIFENRRDVMSSDLIDLEEQNRSKFGPRSIAIPWEERRSGVNEYFSGEYSGFSGLEEKLKLSLPAQTPRLRPLSLDSALSLVKNNTNSGLPYFTRKGSVKDIYGENFHDLLSRKDPCIMFTRTQEQRKTRPVWGYPMADTINEMMYYRPLFQYQSKLRWRSALRGPSEVDRTLVNLVIQARQRKQKLVSVDFSAYDTTVKGSLQDVSFDYIKSNFQSIYRTELDYIAERFKSIGLVTPSGVLSGDHGVPSGSTFTNEVDSIAQYLIAKDFGINDDECDIQGDDGAYRTSNPEGLKENFRDFGLNVNDDKSYVSSGSLIYLQSLYDIEHIGNGIIGGIYPTFRALNRIIYPERFDGFSEDSISGSDYFSIRAIAILENCKHHPLFVEFVRFIHSIDRYNLKFTENGLSSYIKRMERSSGSVGVIENQYGSNLRGLKTFEVMKVLRELNRG